MRVVREDGSGRIVRLGQASDAADLRRIGEALVKTENAEQDLVAAVHAARKNGRSWTVIGMVLGVSKQAAQQRFGGRAAA